MAQKTKPAAMARLDVTETVISSLVARVVGTRVPNDASLMEAGIDSLAASEVVSSIGAELTVELPATLLFDSPSIAAICQHVGAIASHVADDELFSASSGSHSTAGVATLMSTALAARARSKHDEAPVELTRAAGGVAVISYNRPEKGNSFDAAVSRGLICMLGVLDGDTATSSVVVTGRGSYFCAAAKFDEMLGPAHISELAS